MFWWILIFLILYILIDVHYFVRFSLSIVIAKFLRKRTKFLEASTTYGICLPSDADFLLTHMNNGRYLREFDFARFDYFTRAGFLDELISKGASFPVSSISIRYRLPLMMFSPYKIVTRPLWWNNKFCYVQHEVITLRDGITRTVAFVKLAAIKADFEDLAKKFNPTGVKPEIEDDLKKWIESNELSSEKMKAK